MIELSNTRQLYKRLNAANHLLKDAKNSEEKIALVNYIGNLYSAISSVSGIKIRSDKRRIFGSKSNYRKFIKKFDIYEDQMLENFVHYKDFHLEYFEELLSGIEKNLQSSPDLKYHKDTKLSVQDFSSIFMEFMKSVQLDGLFEKYVKEKRIYTTTSTGTMLGFTLYNPLNKDTDLFIQDFQYDIHSMFTLAHEFGHVYDLSHFEEDSSSYNRYFYQSFYGEVLPRLFERLFVEYLIKNHILFPEAKNKLFELEWTNHDYILGSYILSLLEDEYFLDCSYRSLSKDELAEKVGRHFLSEEDIREFILNSTYYDVGEDFTYSYGDIVSLFLKDSIYQGGISNELMDDFFQIRSGLFTDRFLREWGMSPENYVKLHQKELQLLKK